jgi:hypothetical protein
VPAILGLESAYRATRRSDLDYLEAMSVEAAVAALKHLRDDRDLRRAMVENGRRRAEDFHAANFMKRWRTLLANELVATYTEWCNASANARAIFLEQRASSFPSRQTLSLLVGAIKAPHWTNHAIGPTSNNDTAMIDIGRQDGADRYAAR